MKICHVSDNHLGAGALHTRRGETGLTQRQEDIVNSFKEAISRIIALRPDLCVHSGDIFDLVRPLNRIIAIAAEQLHRLADENGIPTVIITGNHDAPKQPHFGAAIEIFRPIRNLHVACNGRLERFRIGDRCLVTALPHCLTAQALNDQLAACIPDGACRFNVLVAHAVAAGMPQFSMADLGEQELPVEVMDRFDYTAMGHFHNYCRVSRRGFYAGSTERLSQAERDAAKGFVEVNLEPFDVRFHELPTRAMVELTAIDGSGKRGDQLAALIRENVDAVGASDKIVRLKVQGVSEEALKTMPVDVINELKQKAYSLNITFEKEKSEGGGPAFGRTGIGRLDTGFIEFLESMDFIGFDKERLRREALKYLAGED
jgi:exonuclease SbcD